MFMNLNPGYGQYRCLVTSFVNLDTKMLYTIVCLPQESTEIFGLIVEGF